MNEPPPVNLIGLSYPDALEAIKELEKLGIAAGITVGGVWTNLAHQENLIPQAGAIAEKYHGTLNVGYTPLQRRTMK